MKYSNFVLKVSVSRLVKTFDLTQAKWLLVAVPTLPSKPDVTR